MALQLDFLTLKANRTQSPEPNEQISYEIKTDFFLFTTVEGFVLSSYLHFCLPLFPSF